MSEVGRATLVLDGDSAGLDRSLRAAESGTLAAAASMKKIGDRISGIGDKLTKRVTLPIIGVGAASFKMASDAEEAANKFNVVMGSSADAVRARLQELTATIPLTRFEMEALAAGIQDMLVPLGIARGEAAGMSGDFVALAGDVASFSNVPVAQVLQDIQSALAGSSEPMRKYGVDTRIAALETVALEEGLIDAGEKMDQAAMAQAVLIQTTRQSADAIGDAARTTDSAANSVKFFWRDIKDLSATVGQDLIPILTPLINDLRSVLGWLKELDPSTRQWILRSAALAAALGPVLSITGRLISVGGSVVGTISSVARSIHGATAAGASWTARLKGAGGLMAALGAAAVVGEVLGKTISALIVKQAEASASASEMAQVADSVRVALNFNTDQINEWVGGLDASIRVLVKQRTEQLLAVAATDELREKYQAMIDAVDAANESISGLGDEFGNILEDIEDLTPVVDELDETIKSLGFTILPMVNKRLDDLGLVIKSGRVPASQLNAEVNRMWNELRDLGLLTPEVRARLLEYHRTTVTAKPATELLRDAVNALANSARDIAPAFKDAKEASVEFFTALPTKIPSIGPLRQLGRSLESVGEGMGLVGRGEGGGLSFTPGKFLSGLGAGITEGLGQAMSQGIAGAVKMAVQFAIKGVIALAKKLVDAFTESTGESLQKDFSQAFGVKISEQFGDVLGEAFGRDSTDAILKGLDKIVEETGSLSIDQFRKITQRALDPLGHAADSASERLRKGHTSAEDFVQSMTTSLPILSRDLIRFRNQVTATDLESFFRGAAEPLALVREGTLSAEDAARIYDATFADLHASFREFGTGGQQAIRQVIEETRELGIESEAVTKVVAAAMDRVAGGVSAMLGAGIDSLEQARLAAAGLTAVFAEMQAQGTPVSEIVRAIGGDAQELAAVFRDKLGQEAPAGLQELLSFTELLSREGIGELIDRANAAGDVFGGLADIGLASQETFSDFAATVRQSFDALLAGGATADQAFAALRPQLQALVDTQADFGFTVDEGTKKLLDQAIAQGKVKGATLDAAEATQAGFEGLFQRFDAMLGKMGIATEGMFRFGDASVESANRAMQAFTGVTESATATAQQITDRMRAATRDISAGFEDLRFEIPVGFEMGDLKGAFEGLGHGPFALQGAELPSAQTMPGQIKQVTRTGPIFAHEGEVITREGRGGGGGEIHNHIHLDGREVATQVIKLRPQLVRRLGLD